MEFFSKLLQDIGSVLTLKRNRLLSISSDRERLFGAAFLFSLPYILHFFLAYFDFGWGVVFLGYALGSVFFKAASLLIAIHFVSFTARKFFSGQGVDLGFFKPIAYGMSLFVFPSLLMFMPFEGFVSFLNFVAFVFLLVITYKLLRFYHRLDIHDSLLLLALGIFVYFSLDFLLSSLQFSI
ncbi:hypothetical protein COU74_04280 [Candidatus Peregrinibacteria bacterium CG10_big_fil_rev_8_21_14_0_10_36_19]|nr:MAG: hypothetical protein COU74_04280 [Candidatus Peregrinibacteria bacterium CG10_big_fil_rev_8_21_14_0_10_36_19]